MVLGAPCGAGAGREAPCMCGFAGQSLRGRSLTRVWPQPEGRTGTESLGRCAVAQDECRDRCGTSSIIEWLRHAPGDDVTDGDQAVRNASRFRAQSVWSSEAATSRLPSSSSTNPTGVTMRRPVRRPRASMTATLPQAARSAAMASSSVILAARTGC